ncbi:MAG: hypothetical protein M0R77_20555 [Gammaproteobacteria bacterium]|nr:hypothetical protein [Gammaproteobacteria bacterium]
MSNAEVIWESKLDDKWDCIVTRVSEYQGRLIVSDKDEIILNESVPLAYGAAFGPDIDDVAQWQDKCVEVVDKYQMN